MSGDLTYPWGEHGVRLGGLTKRELFAAMAMQGMCAHGEYTQATGQQIAAYSIECADALLLGLEQIKEPTP